jgi:hypothetical protein
MTARGGMMLARACIAKREVTAGSLLNEWGEAIEGGFPRKLMQLLLLRGGRPVIIRLRCVALWQGAGPVTHVIENRVKVLPGSRHNVVARGITRHINIGVVAEPFPKARKRGESVCVCGAA